ncbi:MAG TPA: hypothetical protein VKC34_02355 [Blastocatellia bacterium]|nr:hypothetical protein [Blastocatellia bacterium]
MRLNGKGKIRTGRRSRAVALLLLGLFAHSILVCAFHHHSVGRGYDSGPQIVSDCGSHSDHVPVSSGISKCLSCRLQSSFLSDMRSPAWAFALAPGAIASEQARPDPLFYRTVSVLSDRAPPLA